MYNLNCVIWLGCAKLLIHPDKLFFKDKGYQVIRYGASLYMDIGEGRNKMANTKVRIKLKSYEHSLVDMASAKIVEVVKRTGGEVSGPIPLPTEVKKYTILRAVHKYKDSREQFERRTHKRLIDINNPSKETVDALSHLDLPSGVDIQIKL